MSSIFSEAAALCAAGTPFVWATIISQDGSTPRSAGSRMLVLADSIVGTIGGGGMEGGVMAMARESVLRDRKPRIMHYDMSGTEAATAGLICGGVCEVLLAYMEPEQQAIMEAAAQAEAEGVCPPGSSISWMRRKAALSPSSSASTWGASGWWVPSGATRISRGSCC